MLDINQQKTGIQLIRNLSLNRQMLPIPTNQKTVFNLESQLQAIILDIYGTVFISGSGDINFWNNDEKTDHQLTDLLKQFQIQDTAQEVKLNLKNEIKKSHILLKNKGIDFPEINIIDIWKKNYSHLNDETSFQLAVQYEILTNPVCPMPNFIDFLSECRSKNIILGIISNAQCFTPLLFPAFFHKTLMELGFDEKLCYYSFQYNYAKPSLFLFEKAMNKLREKKIEPENVLYIGNDMLNDIYTASSVGLKTCLFAGDKRSLRLRDNHKDIKNIEPNAIIINWQDMQYFIKKM